MASLVQAIFFDLGDTLVTKSNAQYQILPGVMTLLTDLRARHLPLGIISNTGTLTPEQLRAQLPAEFDWTLFQPSLIVLSSVVHVEKPHREIFEIAVQKANLPANTCLYCSEDLTETLAAKRAGLLAARLQKPPYSDANDLLPGLIVAGLLT